MKYRNNVFAVFFALAVIGGTIYGQPDEFKYQGSLNVSGQPANGNFDFEFAVFGQLSGGTAVSPNNITRTNVAVVNGVFSVSLAMAAFIDSPTRFLEIRVRQAGVGSYVTLTPRQQLTTTPYAVMSMEASQASFALEAEVAGTAGNAKNADTAQNALALGGLLASQYILNNDPRLTDARPPTAGSSNYIQNQNSGQQVPANFNIFGSGTIAQNLNAGKVFAGVGTSFSPAISFTADPNTGINNITGDTLDLVTNGASRFRVKPDGKLEIGSTALNNTGNLVIADNLFEVGATIKNSSNSTLATGIAVSADAVAGRGVGGRFRAGARAVDAESISGSTGDSYAVFASATGGGSPAGKQYGIFTVSNAPGSLESYGIFATAGGAATNWAGFFNGDVSTGRLTFLNGASGANQASVCRNNITNFLAGCLAPLASDITNISSFRQSRNVIKELNPVSFNWKSDGAEDLGLMPEDVAKIDRRLVAFDKDGKPEVIKYERLTILLLGALKEQDSEIELQKKRNAELTTRLDSVVNALCAINEKSAICKPQK